MKFLFFIPLLFVATNALSIAVQHRMFSAELSRTTPADIEQTRGELQGLIEIGEEQRALALHNQSIAQAIFDVANGIWQTAFDEEQTALGNQKSAEEAEAAAVVKRDNAISFKKKRIEEKADADNLVPPAEKFMNDEIARVDEEKASLERVQVILNGLLPASEIEKDSGRHLLSSRTAVFLSNPSFLASLSKADPAALKQVLDIVLNLLAEGEADRQYAVGEYNDRVSEAATAKQNLIDAETALANDEQELIDAGEVTAEMTTIAQGKSAIEVEKRGIRDAKQKKLDTQIAFTNREIARIDDEKDSLEETLSLIEKLQKTAELLA